MSGKLRKNKDDQRCQYMLWSTNHGDNGISGIAKSTVAKLASLAPSPPLANARHGAKKKVRFLQGVGVGQGGGLARVAMLSHIWNPPPPPPLPPPPNNHQQQQQHHFVHHHSCISCHLGRLAGQPYVSPLKKKKSAVSGHLARWLR